MLNVSKTFSEPIFIILEYISNGKLLSYLRSHRADGTYYNQSSQTSDEFKEKLSSSDLISFAYQVAKGMEFISSHGVSQHSVLRVYTLVCQTNRTSSQI